MKEASAKKPPLRIRQLGLHDYEETWNAMRDFASNRSDGDTSEIWFVEHPPVFTQGQAGKPEHLLSPGDIPVVQSDRGGQVTYHGPGQAVVYLLLNLKEANIGIRSLVEAIEQAVINILATFKVKGERHKGAPGIYVGEKKIASIGLRVKKFNTYHGVSINTHMELEPFKRINPCGYEGLEVTDLHSLGIETTIDHVQIQFASELSKLLGYTVTP